MPLDEETLRRRRQGGRVEHSGDFPATDDSHLTPGERVAALYQISCRAYACIPDDDPRRQLELSPRLIGGPLPRLRT